MTPDPYGLLSPALKTERMAAARAALNMPAANPQAREDAAAFLARVVPDRRRRLPALRPGPLAHHPDAAAGPPRRW